ncbi:MAG TPA: hypothetical protein GX497_04210 [Bacillus bacterium]|nr:hypothetical protein [Bacillus sp. (in: firmicutes)]
MAEKQDYPSGTAEWKKKAVDWLFEEGLLTDDAWKKQIEEPLPLWAQAVVYQRLFQKLKGANKKNETKL